MDFDQNKPNKFPSETIVTLCVDTPHTDLFYDHGNYSGQFEMYGVTTYVHRITFMTLRYGVRTI